MPYVMGIDLGQSVDHSALSILEVHGKGTEKRYDVRYLEQFRLGTSYPTIIEYTKDLLDRPPLPGQCQLVLDQSGVGRAIFDMFEEAKLKPIGITITGGVGWHRESGRQWHVAKTLLVGTVQKFLQSRRLRIGSSLPFANTFKQELRNFRVRVTKAANEVYESREGTHDDILLSVAVAVFADQHPLQRWAPIDDSSLWFEHNPFRSDPSENVDADQVGGWGWRPL